MFSQLTGASPEDTPTLGAAVDFSRTLSSGEHLRHTEASNICPQS